MRATCSPTRRACASVCEANSAPCNRLEAQGRALPASFCPSDSRVRIRHRAPLPARAVCFRELAAKERASAHAVAPLPARVVRFRELAAKERASAHAVAPLPARVVRFRELAAKVRASVHAVAPLPARGTCYREPAPMARDSVPLPVCAARLRELAANARVSAHVIAPLPARAVCFRELAAKVRASAHAVAPLPARAAHFRGAGGEGASFSPCRSRLCLRVERVAGNRRRRCKPLPLAPGCALGMGVLPTCIGSVPAGGRAAGGFRFAMRCRRNLPAGLWFSALR